MHSEHLLFPLQRDLGHQRRKRRFESHVANRFQYVLFPRSPSDVPHQFSRLLPIGRFLDPVSNIVVYAQDIDAPYLWAVEETKPFWMKIPSFTWDLNAGQLSFQPLAIQFVRQLEDDTLSTNQTSLDDPNTANRVSNDAYYRNADIGSPQAFVTADANGIAQLTTTIALNPPELRPHFPYAGILPGNQIQVAPGGQLALSNSIIDEANSSLPVTAPLPVIYSTDCTDTNCSGATGGSIALQFTPVGSAPLTFTPDGGLLSYGSVPDTKLTWGFHRQWRLRPIPLATFNRARLKWLEHSFAPSKAL